MTFQGNTEAPDQRAVTQASENAGPTFETLSADLYKLGASIDHRLAEIIMLKATIRRYRAAMEAVCDELAEDFDCNYGDGSQPNKAMRLANELKEAIYGPGGY